MAIDTAAKRASVIRVDLPRSLLPPPSGTIGEGQRAHLAMTYSGISASSGGGGGGSAAGNGAMTSVGIFVGFSA